MNLPERTLGVFSYSNSFAVCRASFRPNTIRAPVYLFQKRKLLFEIPSGIDFNKPHDTPDTHLWGHGYQHVDIVFVIVQKRSMLVL